MPFPALGGALKKAARSRGRAITNTAIASWIGKTSASRNPKRKAAISLKSHWKTFSVTKIDKEIRKGVKQELTKYKDEIYDKVTWDVFQQALACCFIALEQMGWGKKRLTDFKDKVDDVTHLMYTGAMGREFTTRDAIQHLKDKYGIDFTESQYKEEYERDEKAKGGTK